MIGIAFDLRRMKFMRLDEHAAGVAAEDDRRGEEHWIAGDQILRLLDVRDDLLRRLTTRGQSRGRDRSSHQLDEVAPVDAVAQRHRLARELFLEEFVEGLGARELLEAAPTLPPAKVADALADLLEVK